MIVEIGKGQCEHLQNISFYCHNYYLLPFQVNGCVVLYEECDECTETFNRSVGNVIDGTYEPLFWLHTDERGYSDNFIFDSHFMKEYNEWS